MCHNLKQFFIHLVIGIYKFYAFYSRNFYWRNGGIRYFTVWMRVTFHPCLLICKMWVMLSIHDYGISNVSSISKSALRTDLLCSTIGIIVIELKRISTVPYSKQLPKKIACRMATLIYYGFSYLSACFEYISVLL